MTFDKNIPGAHADAVENAAAYVPAAGAVTVFSAEWCSHCTRIKHELAHEGIAYTVVDIEADAVAEQVAAALNGGDWVIPTLVFSDGRTIVNAGIGRVKESLAEIG